MPGMEWHGRRRARKQPRHRGTGSSAPGLGAGVVMLCEDVPEHPAATGVTGSFYCIQHSLRLREL